MEEKFKNDLENEKVLALCKNIFYWDKAENSKENEYIRWFILDEQRRAFAGGKYLYTEFDIQVDIYTLRSYRNLSNAIIKALEDKKYTVISNENGVIKKGNIKLYNKTLRFRFNKYN
ncbi:hypothetical protein [Clostridium celatum]|uniref:Uncharacterized protein n=1 Tax=Clostridium celatum DSM 1785 TaxID=545697 RepID=L1QEZ6_9CLOT|nr:hypothetical protein [Clostridium celatum]EKY26553.1 hypothetical protein HMPREF0216_01738 [Clostridium celatum DSM 1785]